METLAEYTSMFLTTIKAGAARYGVNLLVAIAILLIGRLASGLVKRVVRSACDRSGTDPTVGSFLANMAYIGAMAFVVISALGYLGIETASFIAILGAAGLAIGLAFQGSLANFAAGFLMIIFRPFRVGDFIEGGGIAGTVREVNVFTTTLTTPDNKRVIIPNAKVTGDNIINYTAEETRRVDLVIGVGYSDDLDKVRRVLESVVKSFKGVLAEPAPVVAVVEMADSSVNFVVRPWVKPADYWDVHFGLTEAIKKRFDQEGITIPFPQRDIHVHNPPAQA